MERKILAAVDGSVHSYNALRYLSHLFTDLEDISVHLLYVVPAGELPSAKEWMDELELMNCISPSTRKRMRQAKRFMEEAILQLGRRGIAPCQVTTTVKLSQSGVAADIIHHARQGLYDALMIGRRGLSMVEEWILGSVSSTITDLCHEIPIWVVDGKVNSRRFLMPVDHSFNSLKAADHLGFILQGNPYAEITLFHLASLFGGDKKTADLAKLSARWGQEWCDTHVDRDDPVYHAPEQMLIERGIAPERIKRLDKERGFDATRHIVRKSALDKYGTIVVGRRDKDAGKSIAKGISERVLITASQVAIWVIG